MSRTFPLVAALVLLCLTLLAGCGSGDSSSTGNNMAGANAGVYQVGRTALHLVDPARTETFGEGAGTPRELMVYVWYPSTQTLGMRKGPWLDEVISEVLVDAFAAHPATLEGLPTRSYPGAPIAQDGPFPVLLMSHGDGGFPFGYYTLAEHLASHGYVVAGISHTCNAMGTIFPDGRVAMADPAASAIPPGLDEFTEMTYALSQTIWEHRCNITGLLAEDMRFVLNELERLNQAGEPFAGALNMRAVGAFGHSLGGAASVEAMLRDARILAAVNLDGSMSSQHFAAGTTKPILTILNEEHAADLHADLQPIRTTLISMGWTPEQVDTYIAQNSALTIYSAASPQATVISITGSGHLNFSDDAKLRTVMPSALVDPEPDLGSINPEQALRITRHYLRDFFARSLRGQSNTILTGTPPYTEVRIEQY